MRIAPEQILQLAEALQRAQLDKAVRLTGLSADELLEYIARVDPTVDQPENAMKGKYAPWLVARLVQGFKQQKQAQWLADNPEKAAEQGLLGYVEPGEKRLNVLKLEARREARRLRDAAHENIWIYGLKDELHDALARFDHFSERGWLRRAGLPQDINQYKDARGLVDQLAGVGGPIEYVIENPGELDFEIVHKQEDPGVYILKTSNAETARKLGACAGWCFGSGRSWAQQYTWKGPLYLMFIGPDVDYSPMLRASKSDVFLDVKALAAISPYSGTSPDREEVPENNAFEIRDASNNWIDPEALEDSSPDLLDPVTQVMNQHQEQDPDSALGFDLWVDQGTYSVEDIIDYMGLEEKF